MNNECMGPNPDNFIEICLVFGSTLRFIFIIIFFIAATYLQPATMLQHSLYELIHHIFTAAAVHLIQLAGLRVGFSDYSKQPSFNCFFHFDVSET